MAEKTVLTGYTIYDHPLDYPNDFVVRAWDVKKSGNLVLQNTVTRHETLEQARRRIPEGLSKVPRFLEDDPVIIEVWI